MELTEEDLAEMEDALLDKMSGCDCRDCGYIRQLLDHARVTLEARLSDPWR